MSDFDWKGLVKTVAPTVASALGGPLAGTAVRVLSESLLGRPDASEAEVSMALQSATPEQLLALKKADQEYAVQIKALDVELEKAAIADTGKAREAHAGDRRVFWLGVAVLVTFFITVSAVLYSAHQMLLGGMKVSDPSTVAVVFTLIGTVIGYVAANAQQVIGYFFGSSAGSQKKSEDMAKAVEQLGKK